MSATLRATHGLARATLLDTLRRPGFALGTVALGALLAILPRLGSPAAGVRDNAALALELSISTLALVGPLVAGLLAVRASQPDHDAGPSPEILGTPGGRAAYVAGRWAGVGIAAILVCAGAAGIGIVGWLGRPAPSLPSGAIPWVALLCGLPVAVLLGAALGLFYGSVVGRDLAFLTLVLHIAGARLLTAWGDEAARVAPWLRHAVPDPSRLDVATELAFGRALSDSAVVLALTAAVLQQTALVLLVPVILRSRQRR